MMTPEQERTAIVLGWIGLGMVLGFVGYQCDVWAGYGGAILCGIMAFTNMRG